MKRVLALSQVILPEAAYVQQCCKVEVIVFDKWAIELVLVGIYNADIIVCLTTRRGNERVQREGCQALADQRVNRQTRLALVKKEGLTSWTAQKSSDGCSRCG